MSVEIRIDAVPWTLDLREEVLGDFPGCDDVRRGIVRARDAGDEDEVHRLQRVHRDLRLGTRNTATSETPMAPITTPTATRTTVAPDYSRCISGYCCTWDATDSATTKDGERVGFRFGRHSFDQWLSALDPGDEPLGVFWKHGYDDRMPLPIGYAAAFDVDSVGLLAMIELCDEPGHEVVLEAADRGELAFSVRAIIQSSTRTNERIDGQVVFICDAAGLNEVSLLRREDAADRNARVITVRGQRPSYLLREDAVDRDRKLRELYGFGPRSSRASWHNVGVRPAEWGR